MRITAFTGVVIGLALSLCASQALSANKDATRIGVTSVLNMQADAWNRGDLDAFMKGYLDSPDTSYTSGGQQFWGYEALRRKYAKSYGTNADTMGKLSFEQLKIVDIGKNNALCVGEYHLQRTGQPEAEGIFSLVLVRTPSGWKIIHDHTTSGIKREVGGRDRLESEVAELG